MYSVSRNSAKAISSSQNVYKTKQKIKILNFFLLNYQTRSSIGILSLAWLCLLLRWFRMCSRFSYCLLAFWLREVQRKIFRDGKNNFENIHKRSKTAVYLTCIIKRNKRRKMSGAYRLLVCRLHVVIIKRPLCGRTTFRNKSNTLVKSIVCIPYHTHIWWCNCKCCRK